MLRATYIHNEIYINDCSIGKVLFKKEKDFGIFHIRLQLNQFHNEIHICRSNLAATIITVMKEFLGQSI